ncbi:MAG: riboflavin synthase [Gammaproteobacteria bacterium]|nr:riboflavin synthase [Gammaproteobacteria bacterium]
MFTGIVKGTGKLVDVTDRGSDRTLVVGTAGVALGEIKVGDSIAVNGVCLTATDVQSDAFTADVSAETLARTTLGRLERGTAVNLESSLKLGDSLDGHLVFGHVDGVGQIASLAESGRSTELVIDVPEGLGRYIAVKGSVTVDGTSLTVNAVARDRFTVNIIPHTREITIISAYGRGTPVNIEVDMIARYLERLVGADRPGLTRETLERHGFIDATDRAD